MSSPTLDHINITSQAKTGILNEFGGDGTSGLILNDEVEVENSPSKRRKPVSTKAQSTEPTAEKNAELVGEKDSEAEIEKSKEQTLEKTTATIEDKPIVEKSTNPATKKSAKPVVEKNSEAGTEKKNETVQSSEKTKFSSSSASENSTSSSSTSTLNIPVADTKSLKPVELPLISLLQSVEPSPSTEPEPASGQDLYLGPFKAMPIRAVSPSTSIALAA